MKKWLKSAGLLALMTVFLITMAACNLEDPEPVPDTHEISGSVIIENGLAAVDEDVKLLIEHSDDTKFVYPYKDGAWSAMVEEGYVEVTPQLAEDYKDYYDWIEESWDEEVNDTIEGIVFKAVYETEKTGIDVSGKVELEDAEVVLQSSEVVVGVTAYDENEAAAATTSITIDQAGEFEYTLEDLVIGEEYTIKPFVVKDAAEHEDIDEETSQRIVDATGFFSIAPEKVKIAELEEDPEDIALFKVRVNDHLIEEEKITKSDAGNLVELILAEDKRKIYYCL